MYIKENYEQALKYITKASELQTHNPRMKVGIVKVLVAQQKYQQALDVLTNIFKVIPTYPEANYYLAYIKMEQEKFDASLKAANLVLTYTPQHYPSQFIVAVSSFHLKRYEESYNLSSRLLHAFPNDNSLLKLVAANQLKLNAIDEAVSTLKKINTSTLTAEDSALFSYAGGLNSAGIGYTVKKELLNQAIKLSGQDDRIYFQLATIAFNEGDKKAGRQHLEQALQLNPKALASKALLISHYIEENEQQLAQETISQLIIEHPNSPDGWTLQGILHLELEQLDQANEAFNHAVAITPGAPSASHNLAVLAINDKNYQQAIDIYRSVIKNFPNDTRAPTQLYLLERHAGNKEVALSWLEEAVAKDVNNLNNSVELAEHYLISSQFEKMIALLQPMKEKYPTAVRPFQLIGQAYYLTGDNKQAMNQLESAKMLMPESSLTHYWLAMVHEKTNNVTEALAAIEKVLSLTPEHLQSQLAQLRLLMKSSNIDAARDKVKLLRKRIPANLTVLEYEAKIANIDKQYPKAIELFSQLFEQQKNNINMLQLASIYKSNGQHSAAEKLLTDWLAQYPVDLLTLNVTANFYLDAANQAKARELLSKIVSLEPNNAFAQNNLAWILFQQGSIVEAEKHAIKANLQNPVNSQFLDTLGQIQLAKGDYAQSRKTLLLANQYAPNDLNIKFQLARAAAKAGQAFEAKSILQELLTEPSLAKDSRQSAAVLLKELDTGSD
jgi:putative PEP-CTERM system TPR-repeat lipoprotein